MYRVVSLIGVFAKMDKVEKVRPMRPSNKAVIG